MTRTTYNKLVRDFIPHKIKDVGDICEVRTLDREAFIVALRAKVVEEATELTDATTREDILSEYADLMVALDAFTEMYEFSEADIKEAMSRNIEKKGLFEKRFFLEWSEYTK